MQTSSFSSEMKEKRLEFVVKRIAMHLEVPIDVKLITTPLRAIYEKMQKRTQGRNIRGLGSVVFYHKCKANGIVINLEEVLEVFNISKQRYRLIVHHIHKEGCLELLDPKYKNEKRAHEVPKEVNQLASRFVLKHYGINSKNYENACGLPLKIIGLAERFFVSLCKLMPAMKPRCRMAYSILLVQDALKQKRELNLKKTATVCEVAHHFQVAFSSLYDKIKAYQVKVMGEKYGFIKNNCESSLKVESNVRPKQTTEKINDNNQIITFPSALGSEELVIKCEKELLIEHDITIDFSDSQEISSPKHSQTNLLFDKQFCVYKTRPTHQSHRNTNFQLHIDLKWCLITNSKVEENLFPIHRIQILKHSGNSFSPPVPKQECPKINKFKSNLMKLQCQNCGLGPP